MHTHNSLIRIKLLLNTHNSLITALFLLKNSECALKMFNKNKAVIACTMSLRSWSVPMFLWPVFTVHALGLISSGD